MNGANVLAMCYALLSLQDVLHSAMRGGGFYLQETFGRVDKFGYEETWRHNTHYFAGKVDLMARTETWKEDGGGNHFATALWVRGMAYPCTIARQVRLRLHNTITHAEIHRPRVEHTFIHRADDT